MKHLYLIEKSSSHAWGINPWVPHQVFMCKKNAIAQCKILTDKAQRNRYQVTKVLNGDVKLLEVL